MKATEQPSLVRFNTFGVDARAGLMLTLENEEDLLSLAPFDPKRDLLLGGGSNLLLAGDIPGTVVHNQISGKEVVDSDRDHVLVEAGAGENWHELVLWSLSRGYSGLENLSLIPGLAGAAPIQNIGAYGVELSSVLESVTAWDLQRSTWVSFSCEQCQLAYRDSLFKTGQPDRYLITSIRLRLDRCFNPVLGYSGLSEELARAGIGQPNAIEVSDAVIRLRRLKLPDPSVTGNAGSFFKNPVLRQEEALSLLALNPDMPAWPNTDETVKISAAWMIEHCGFKGFRQGDAGVSAQHALVIVNHGSARGREIMELATKIRSTVYSTFGIELQPEPRIVRFPI